MTRRELFALAPAAFAQPGHPPLHRRAIVSRHNPEFHAPDFTAPLSVGNGEFAFTADFTGLQTFPELYERTTPLCTQSQWGWHTSPIPHGLDPSQLRLKTFDTYGRRVGYATSARGQEPLYNWMRENPRRLNLARIGLLLGGAPLRLEEITAIDQKLDLWTGILESRFRLRGEPVAVVTCCHPSEGLLAVTITSPLVARGLAVVIDFPYGSPEMNASDWKSPDRHSTRVASQTSTSLLLDRQLDQDKYTVDIGAPRGVLRDKHRVVLEGKGSELNFVCRFAPSRSNATLPATGSVRQTAARYWSGFWSIGGTIDFSGSTDPRAQELERRAVLSQYLTAIQCAGSSPPQETGLTCNSWYGKFHLEMYLWHAAHFALWNRASLLERSLGWYSQILPSARERAHQQGYAGARWPKMTALDGRDSPSPIGPLLIWQQPHPILLAELCYPKDPEGNGRRMFQEIVFESAEFMASYAVERDGRYML
ncbi:MAG TPA: glycoside hydrolase family 65, partial [Bryobacteraceae bacterium]|nr:glycoside hydrolase family 65 [Bryobacteraceae bacterium]